MCIRDRYCVDEFKLFAITVTLVVLSSMFGNVYVKLAEFVLLFHCCVTPLVHQLILRAYVLVTENRIGVFLVRSNVLVFVVCSIIATIGSVTFIQCVVTLLPAKFVAFKLTL